KRIDISDIDFDIAYEGYYWYSDTDRPEMVLHEKISPEIFSALPFIIEGNLYAEEPGFSIQIKNIDGAYRIYRTELSGLNPSQITGYEYLAHKLPGVSKIKMLKYWEETAPDPLLENMKTLVPARQAFVGF